MARGSSRGTRWFPCALAVAAVSLTCVDHAPTEPVPQLEGIGSCCWDPGWQFPVLDFAPIIYQDVDASWADFLTRFTFDNDWNGGNNWDNTFSYPLRAYVYTSVVETFAHYFIFYGFFHPRDWCTINFPAGWFCDWPWQHSHENDMEGMMVTVDKRFTTLDWPYGQIVTIETISHDATYKAYKNCDFTEYSVIPDPLFKSRQAFDGCVVWQVDQMQWSGETPPARPAIFVQARGHGVSMRSANWSGFPGSDGVIYYPAAPPHAPEVPPSTLSPPVAYMFQPTTLWELGGSQYPKSLWSQRLSSGGLPTSTYERLHDGPVGPFDVLYGHVLNCAGQPCGADAPWGQKHDVISSVHMGDWHNHPAWAWSQHYQPGPSPLDSIEYPYCRAPECRMNSGMYVTNFYWDSAAAPQDFVDLHVAGVDPNVVGSGPEPVDRAVPPELRWDFDTLPVVHAAGTSVGVSERMVADADWGYRSRTTDVLRLTGTGPIRLTLPAEFDPSEYRYAYVRFRCVQGSARTVRVGSRRAGELDVQRSREIELSARHAGDWEVAMIPLRDQPAWPMSSDADAVVVVLDGEGPVVIDVDFVIIAP